MRSLRVPLCGLLALLFAGCIAVPGRQEKCPYSLLTQPLASTLAALPLPAEDDGCD